MKKIRRLQTQGEGPRMLALEPQMNLTHGLTPKRLRGILELADQGDILEQHLLFADMEDRCEHLAAEMGKRKRALLTLDWEILPGRANDARAARIAAAVREQFDAVNGFEDLLMDLADGIGHGFSACEIEWDYRHGLHLPAAFHFRPQSWFQLHRGYRQELRLRSDKAVDGIPGEPLNPFGWVTHVHKAKSGYLERSALFRQLVWTYLFKNYSVGDLAEFLEIYGIPLRIGKYPSSASEKDKAMLLRALASIGHNAAGIVPEGMLLEFKDAATGDPKAFELMMSWCEKNQSKVILGGTLTSGADGKSSTNALGNIHNEVRKDLRDGDVRQLDRTLTRDLVYAVAALNGLAPDGLRRCPQFKLNAQETEDLTAYAQALPQLVGIGVQPTVKWAHEKLGIPMPQAGEAVLTPPGNAPGLLGQAGPPALAALTALPSLPTPALTPPVAMQAQLADQVEAATAPWLASIRQLVETAASLEDIRDGLEQLIPNMTLAQYAQAMGEALAAAQLAGRYEVLQEAAGHG